MFLICFPAIEALSSVPSPGYLLSVLLLLVITHSIILYQTIEALSYAQSPELALRLYLQCAEVNGDLHCLHKKFWYDKIFPVRFSHYG